MRFHNHPIYKLFLLTLVIVSLPLTVISLQQQQQTKQNAAETSGIVDMFGQYTGLSWPGKITSVQDIITSRNQEQYQGVPPDRDTYGGFNAITIPNTSGHFIVEKYNGHWFLITPDSHPFFSLGMDVVTNTDTTITGGQENLFQWLPDSSDPLAAYYGTYANQKTYDFYKANLYKANNNNPNFQADWERRMYNRLLSWGFNTLGDWSDSNMYTEQKMPFLVPADSVWNGSPAKTFPIPWTNTTFYLPDVFDPSFTISATQGIHAAAPKCSNNPWCIGIFVDNEVHLSYPTNYFVLSRAVLTLPATWKAKQTFSTQLQAKYTTIANLNSAWNTTFTSWSDFENQNVTLPSTLTAAQESDLSQFLTNYESTYFSTISGLVHQYIPNTLYLGSRFTNASPKEAVQACNKYCDVVSFNEYRTLLTGTDPTQGGTPDLSFLNQLDKPVIIGEFHFMAPDTGYTTCNVTAATKVSTQEERAQRYTGYLQSALAFPSIVGVGWFQYLDEPLTGRITDPENCNTGFVTIADTVYTPLASAAAAINRNYYHLLFPAVPTSTPTQQITRLSFTLCPHGLGNCGDNIASASGGTVNPHHQSRNVKITILNTSNTPVATLSGTATYNTASKNFSGSVPVENISSGSYLVTVSMDGFLHKKIPGIITFTTNHDISLPSVALVSADINNDNRLDILDYNLMLSCFGSKYTSSSCAAAGTPMNPGADSNDDGIVDGIDYNLFLRELSVQKGE